eukprot:gene6724-1203_t
MNTRRGSSITLSLVTSMALMHASGADAATETVTLGGGDFILFGGASIIPARFAASYFIIDPPLCLPCSTVLGVPPAAAHHPAVCH